MKKYGISLVLALAFCISSVAAQQSRRETLCDGLVGSVQKVVSTMYLAQSDGESMSRGSALEHLETVYNIKGQRRSMSFLSTEEDAVMFRTRYKHDAFGNTTLEHVVDNNEAVIGRTYYIYNANFVLTESYVEDAERQVEYRIKYKYDGSGRLSQRSFNDAENKVYRREQYAYNPDGTVLSTIVYNRQDKKIQELRYEYDKYRQPVTKTVYDFSEDEPEVFVTLFRYQYDGHGNWIQRTEYSVEGGDSYPEYITERSIQYFEWFASVR